MAQFKLRESIVARTAKMDQLLVWDEDPGTFDDFAAQCRRYRDGLKPNERNLATTHAIRLFAAKGGKTWNLLQSLDERFLQADFGIEYLLWRIKEVNCRPYISEVTKYLDEYFFCLRRKKPGGDERLGTPRGEGLSSHDSHTDAAR